MIPPTEVSRWEKATHTTLEFGESLVNFPIFEELTKFDSII